MEYKFKTLAAIILTTGFTLSHAGFTYVYPMEASSGGPLANNSITFVDKGSIGSGTGNNGGSNIGSGGETTDDRDEETVTPPDLSALEPSEKCDLFSSEANTYLKSAYSDTQLISHELKTTVIPTLGSRLNCALTISFPQNKAFICTGKNNYAEQIGNDISSLARKYSMTITYVYSYSGSCY
ncbi:hypothetical protein SOX05_08430 [Pseudomonas putida]|nr:hypothetical protein [Pseudomonas putida]MDY4319286.1 hypothetical protein [Pseudomonas putida]MDY4352671.1 hypothetical protein [Pseudomonas putida]